MTEPAPEPTDVDALYAQGEPVVLVADLFPALVSPQPEYLPRGTKLRALITDKAVIFAWSTPTPASPVSSVMLRTDTEETDYRGGSAAGLQISRANGCACGARLVRTWMPFHGRAVTVRTRRTAGLPR